MGDWRHRAACRDVDPELFYPVGYGAPAMAQIAEAKTVCRRCPVNAECLNWALTRGEAFGVWGGMSETDRRALKRDEAEQSGVRRVALERCKGKARHVRTEANTRVSDAGGLVCKQCEADRYRRFDDRRKWPA